jgi:hypothetical protein
LYLSLALIGIGASALLGACAWALLRKPRIRDTSDDTMMIDRSGPEDGELVQVAGRVAVERPVYSPSGTACAMYEVYGGAEDQPARPLRRRAMPFTVDDGIQAVRIEPTVAVVAFDLPAEALDGPGDDEATVVIERRLEPGARVQVVGRVRRIGAPGHEEFFLDPPDGAGAVPLTWLSA